MRCHAGCEGTLRQCRRRVSEDRTPIRSKAFLHALFYATGNGPRARERRPDLPHPIPPDVRWRRSSHSNPDGADCVEVARHRGAVYIRDSKNRSGPMITLSPGNWTHLVTSLRERR
ncbi:DUF397 domain-containing protein [Actinomadura sp. 9N215]|uniref:DUF397 domain-containing protein n=1 Tax=Actinomadura sp. 9N215 TaxID=3375150 RepID=UPI0037AE7E17